jgi:hypothetical protein
MSDSNHGGSREGAGRPKSEQTKMMRVPLGAESLVRELIESYKRNADNVFIFDGSELYMVMQYIKRKKVYWNKASVRSLDEDLMPVDIHTFVGDELLICMARKGIIKAQP